MKILSIERCDDAYRWKITFDRQVSLRSGLGPLSKAWYCLEGKDELDAYICAMRKAKEQADD